MSFTIERLKNKPAYLATLNEDFDIAFEISNYYVELFNLLEEETETVSIILDIRPLPVNMETLMAGTKSAKNAGPNPYEHETVKQLILITDSKLVKMSISGFRKFGVAENIQAADSIEGALTLL